MPHTLRIECPSAIYHRRNRGDRRQPICRDDRDRKRFRTRLAATGIKTDWPVPTFWLRPHHFHLVGETPNPNRVAGSGNGSW